VKVGLIGLGRRGMNLGKNLMDSKHHVVAFDLNINAVEEIKKYGGEGASSLQDLVQSLVKTTSSLDYGPTLRF
jgi:6-phosphogluconate dehydrogenase